MQESAQLVTVDPRRLSFVGCGLAVLLAAAQRASARGDSLRMVRVPRDVHRLFELNGSDRRREITHTG